MPQTVAIDPIEQGDMVRISTRQSRRFGKARVVAVDGDRITVKPLRHKRLEVVSLRDCRLWKSRTKQQPNRHQ